MKLLQHHEHHRHESECQLGKRQHKIMRKMAKLERKLSKYNFRDSSPDSGSCASDAAGAPRSRSHSRSRGKRVNRRHRRQAKQASSSEPGSKAISDDSSASSSESDSSTSSSGSSSSGRHHHPHHRHHHHHRGPRLLLRSKSFGGHRRHTHSPSRHHHHHHHHHRGRHAWHQDSAGAQGRFRPLARSEPNLQESQETRNGANGNEESRSRSASREPAQVRIYPNLEEMELNEGEEVFEDTVDTSERADVPAEGPEIDAALAEDWSKIVKTGLPTDSKEALLRAYPISKNCPLLKAPKVNAEIKLVATKSAIERDGAQACQQNQIGAGLSALGRAVTDLKKKTGEEVGDVLETLSDAAKIFADVHRDMTESRRSFMYPELRKGVRPVVEEGCEADEFLYGKDFAEKVKNVKDFAKIMKKISKAARCDKGEKRKGPDRVEDKCKWKRR